MQTDGCFCWDDIVLDLAGFDIGQYLGVESDLDRQVYFETFWKW